MKQVALFKSNRSQAVRIPKEYAFPEGMGRVTIRKVGKSVILTPTDSMWEDFFNEPGDPTFPEREPQPPYDVREDL